MGHRIHRPWHLESRGGSYYRGDQSCSSDSLFYACALQQQAHESYHFRRFFLVNDHDHDELERLFDASVLATVGFSRLNHKEHEGTPRRVGS